VFEENQREQMGSAYCRMYGHRCATTKQVNPSPPQHALLPLPLCFFTTHLRAGALMRRNGGTSSLNSPVNYRESSSSPSLSPVDATQSPSRDEVTPTPAASTSKSVPKKRKPRDPDKPPKPRKPRAPKNPSDSPSKTHVNRFKQHLGPEEMVRTVSESGFASGGSSAMARVPLPLSMSISSAFIVHVGANE